MIIISHRGNILGKNLNRENTPDYIDEAIKLKLTVEVDIRYINNNFYLGHDNAKVKISYKWLFNRRNKLLIHCKNLQSLYLLKKNFHTFYHSNDDFVLTSKNLIWQHNLRFQITSRSIIPIFSKVKLINYLNSSKILYPYGICTDWPELIEKK